MKCDNCGEETTMIVGNYPFFSNALGTISVPNVKFIKCGVCGDTYLSLQEAEKVTDFVREREIEAISGIPIGEFVSQNEAANILGMSKQAFSKNSRINRGFIYSIRIDGRSFFYRKSVEQFNNTGDGRIRLDVVPSTPAVILREGFESHWMSLIPQNLAVLGTVISIESAEVNRLRWLN